MNSTTSEKGSILRTSWIGKKKTEDHLQTGRPILVPCCLIIFLVGGVSLTAVVTICANTSHEVHSQVGSSFCHRQRPIIFSSVSRIHSEINTRCSVQTFLILAKRPFAKLANIDDHQQCLLSISYKFMFIILQTNLMYIYVKGIYS